MPANNVNASPGVYTNTQDLSNRIRAVSTSIVATVGGAPKGPVLVPTLTTDHEEYRSMFGVTNPKKHGFMSQTLNPILNVTNRAYVIRVTNQALYAGCFLTVDDPNATDPILRLTNFDDGSNQPKGKLDPNSEIGFKQGDPGVNLILGAFYAANPGAWNNTLSILVRPANPEGVALRGNGHNVKHFYVEVFENYQGGTFEQPVEKFLVTRHDEIDEEGNQLFIEDVINTNSKYIRFKNNPLCAEVDIVNSAQEQLEGGYDGLPPTNDQISKAWELFEDTDSLNVNILVNNGYTNHNVQRKIHEVAKKRGDAFAVLDMPKDKQKTADAIAYKINTLNLDTDFAGIYSPDVLVTDPGLGKKMYVPVSGYIASVMAYTDATRGVWFAPAGIERGTLRIEGLREHYNQGHRDALSDAQVNAIRNIPGQGYVVWDQQTTQRRASHLQWVNVRRLINFVLKSTSLTAKYGLFDPNDEFLRNNLKAQVEDFLKPILLNRGIREFKVVCDESNNTPQTIANGDLILDMYIDPVIATKRVHVIFNINPTGSRATV